MPSYSPHPNRANPNNMSGMNQGDDMGRPFDNIMMELQGIRDKFKDEDDYTRGKFHIQFSVLECVAKLSWPEPVPFPHSNPYPFHLFGIIYP